MRSERKQIMHGQSSFSWIDFIFVLALQPTLPHLSRLKMGKTSPNRKYPLQVRLEKDVEKAVLVSSKNNCRTAPKEVNFQLRKTYGIGKL